METSTSDSTAALRVGDGAIRSAPPSTGSGTGPDRLESTSSRFSRSSSWWSPPPGSASVPRTRGTAPRASTARSRPWATANSVEPSVLTMSGSSTPASCTLVVEESSPGVAAPRSVVGVTSSGRAGPVPSVCSAWRLAYSTSASQEEKACRRDAALPRLAAAPSRRRRPPPRRQRDGHACAASSRQAYPGRAARPTALTAARLAASVPALPTPARPPDEQRRCCVQSGPRLLARKVLAELFYRRLVVYEARLDAPRTPVRVRPAAPLRRARRRPCAGLRAACPRHRS